VDDLRALGLDHGYRKRMEAAWPGEVANIVKARTLHRTPRRRSGTPFDRVRTGASVKVGGSEHETPDFPGFRIISRLSPGLRNDGLLFYASNDQQVIKARKARGS